MKNHKTCPFCKLKIISDANAKSCKLCGMAIYERNIIVNFSDWEKIYFCSTECYGKYYSISIQDLDVNK